MRSKEIPQDHDSFYDGALRACYAIDDEGRYVMATSRGWHVETLATRQAVEDLERKLEQISAGRGARRVEPACVSHGIQNDDRPDPGAKRSVSCCGGSAGISSHPYSVDSRASILERYAEQLDLSVAQLRRVPDCARTHVLQLQAK